jgi:hypothetical protein
MVGSCGGKFVRAFTRPNAPYLMRKSTGQIALQQHRYLTVAHCRKPPSSNGKLAYLFLGVK